MRLYIGLVFGFIIINTLFSQEQIDTNALKPKYGIFGHYNINLFSGSFRKLPEVPCCSPEFTSGSGSGFSVGALFEYPMKLNYGLSFRAYFGILDGILKKEETLPGIIDGIYADVISEHKIDAKISMIAIEPAFYYNLYKKLNIQAGPNIGLFVNNTYSQKEEIIKPTDRGVYAIEGTRTKNIRNDEEIPKVNSLQFGISLGLNYELMLNKTGSLFLYPELFYTFCFTNVAQNTTWNIHTIRAGIAIKYRQPPPPPPPPPAPLAPIMPDYPNLPSTPDIYADVLAVQVDSSNNENSEINLKIEDFITYNMRPLLNYIFFDDNQAEIPTKYIRLKPDEIDGFKLEKLHSLEVLPTYYHILNIIGYRLKQQSDAKITIVGTNNNTGLEKSNLELSRKRAENVRNYLRDIWGIAESQMKIEARNLPKQATNMDEEGGADENRRVEIHSNDFSINEPVMTIDTLRQISNTTVRFYPKQKAEAGLAKWNLALLQNNKELVNFSGDKELPASIDWKISQNEKRMPKEKGSIKFQLSIEDILGQSFQTEKKSFNIEQLTIDQKRQNRIADKEIEYYSLILFDFGKSKLGPEHQKVLDFIKNRISSGSTVIINGYSDKLGDEELNKKLSDERAKEVAKKLNIPNAIVEGIGEKELIYDNSIPEGRFYCRTVRITIETLINGDGSR